ncbi:hypothetical protein BAS06_02960 [Elizabethkingia miricola]|uniref:helix-turn-helix domain-containing protein n=1 Tax=Elizabethkingia TaxID=308865 RepID=UPI000999115B|nr:helix-turn-helix transcriptional regulator [Elizabethkingia miricola]MCT4185323.1 helix-turn-helix transcriptional regulator [Elizabethkingia anophelis]MCT4274432.1 helix-turn-helix transcriptional regulator [Elizabethkingia anophelis]MCT4292047.1 helix-turn-helix transcriptional regulator [Elizabethkingia anophelis]MDV3462470.1 XRE family transcriptional regulator [Elizabethkingia anophelis]MDV3631356.1 XRE family transcriptional regulator [Elizabethkingia anophelis]
MTEHQFYVNLGSNISSIRTKKGLNQEDLANQLGLSRPSIANIEKGKQKPSIFTLVQISKHLDIKIEELLPDVTIDDLEIMNIIGLDINIANLKNDSNFRNFLSTI